MKRTLAMMIGFALLWGAGTSGNKAAADAPAPGALSTPVPAVPGAAFPDTLGYVIHFTAPQTGEVKLIRDSGVRWVRNDLLWKYTETKPGVYDFSAYDGLLSALDQYQLKAMLILDYGNPLFDSGAPPTSDAAVQAFARWAAGAVSHFKGRGVIWEMWNEPPGFGYKDDKVYSKLALATGAAIKAVAPEEQFVGPATAGADVGYAALCLAAGMSKYWTAISIHPYTPMPEQVLRFYPALKSRVAPLPLYSSEWGYSTAGDVPDDAMQAKYVAREWLVNALSGIGLSIWYDWKDDGPDPKNKQHHFGVVHSDLSLKPAYTAAKTLTSKLAGYGFSKMLSPVHAPYVAADYLLAFDPVSGSGATKYVVWTTAPPHRVSISVPSGRFHQTSYLGEVLPDLRATNKLEVQVTDGPVYLEPAK
jgi:polysaccharide biosynthesis protein PslG